MIGNLTNQWDTTAFKANAYVQLARNFFKRLRVSVGGRLDYFNLIENPVVFAPRASLRYALTDISSISLSGGTYDQAPSYIWLLSNGANTRLNHVRENQAVLGVEHLLRSDLRVRVEGYIKDYADYPASSERPWLVLANTGAGFGGAEDGFSSFGFDNLLSAGTGSPPRHRIPSAERLSDIPLYGILSFSYNHSDYTALDQGASGIV